MSQVELIKVLSNGAQKDGLSAAIRDAGRVAQPPASEDELTMIDMANRIKQELDIAPGMPVVEAIEEACAKLGVDVTGLNLKQKAQRCFAEVA